MNLPKETFVFFRWLHAVMGVFLRVSAIPSVLAVFLTVLSRLSRLLAFFLPLKVILLVASDGVPRYFRAFITPETRDTWLVVLAVGTVVFYVLSLLSDALKDRFALTGSAKVLEEADKLTVISDQPETARRYYGRFCAAYASLAFGCFLLGVGLWLNTQLFLFVLALILAEFVFSSVLLRRAADSGGHKTSALVTGSGTYLALLASINFLAVFGFLLYQFVVLEYGHLLIAILCILMSRQLFGNLSDFLNHSVSLSREKRQINAIMFRDHQLHRGERAEHRKLRRLFKAADREARTAAALGVEASALDTRWVDSDVRGISVFEVRLQNKGGEQTLHERVYSPRLSHLLDNEDFLFRHFTREALKAPRLVAEHQAEDFACRVHDLDGGRRPSSAAWPAERKSLLLHCWQLEPSEHLYKTYVASKPLLNRRLNQDLVERLEVAVDEAWAIDAYGQLIGRLKSVQNRLARVPLFVYNPELSRLNAITAAAGNTQLLDWGRWTLEPLGVGFDPAGDERDWLETALATVRRHRTDLPPDISVADLLLAATAFTFEGLMLKNRYKAALALAPEMLTHLELNVSESGCAERPAAVEEGL